MALTVGELIDILGEFDPDAPVFHHSTGGVVDETLLVRASDVDGIPGFPPAGSVMIL